MSDNLSTKDQAAVAEVNDAVVGLADSTTERNGTAGQTEEQPEDSNDASSAVADDTDPDKLSGIASGVSKANASKVSASKANANVVSILYHQSLPQTTHHSYPTSLIILPTPCKALSFHYKAPSMHGLNNLFVPHVITFL